MMCARKASYPGPHLPPARQLPIRQPGLSSEIPDAPGMMIVASVTTGASFSARSTIFASEKWTAPAVQVPTGTYTGWNLRPRGLAEDELSGLLGSYLPFARTRSKRRKTGDPRLSIEERYKDHADYVQQVSRAARTLVDERFLLPEDAERIIQEAKKLSLFRERKAH